MTSCVALYITYIYVHIDIKEKYFLFFEMSAHMTIGFAIFLAIWCTVHGFAPRSQFINRIGDLKMAKKGAGFNYDPSNYKDSNDANYRRLTDQLAAVKAEDDKMKREREELIRKEQMALFELKKENITFWTTPGDAIVGTSEKYFIPPQVLQVINDLDNQLIGLKPVRWRNDPFCIAN